MRQACPNCGYEPSGVEYRCPYCNVRLKLAVSTNVVQRPIAGAGAGRHTGADELRSRLEALETRTRS